MEFLLHSKEKNTIKFSPQTLVNFYVNSQLHFIHNCVLVTKFLFIIKLYEKMKLFLPFGIFLAFTFVDSTKNDEKSSKYQNEVGRF